MKKVFKIMTLLVLAVACVIGASACSGTVAQTGISLNKAEIALAPNTSETLSAVIAPENATDKTVVWESSNQSVAVVQDGTVTALTKGRATITAKTADEKFFATCEVSVVDAEMLNFTFMQNGDYYTITGVRDASIKEIIIPDSVTEIASDAFYSCTNLAIVSIGNGITSISEDLFIACENLISVTIGESVESIGELAFQNCTRLIEVINKSPSLTIEKGSEDCGYAGYNAKFVSNCDQNYERKVTVDGNGYVICENTSLIRYLGNQLDIVTPAGITDICDGAFKGNGFIKSVIISNGVETVGTEVFAECRSLKSAIIPNSQKNVGDKMFYDCTALTSVTLGESVETIGKEAFYNCSELPLIELPVATTYVLEGAFSNCTAMWGIIVGATYPNFEKNAFYECQSLGYIFYKQMRGSGGILNFTIVEEGNNAVYGSGFFYYSPEYPTWLGNFWRYVDGIPKIWETT